MLTPQEVQQRNVREIDDILKGLDLIGAGESISSAAQVTFTQLVRTYRSYARHVHHNRRR